MTAGPLVIIGAGQAGGRAALSLRENGYAGALTLIGAEAAAPYERPPLSKEFLAGEIDAEGLSFAPQARLDELGITFLPGVEATAIDRAGKAVVLADGRRVPYARLLIATGREPRRLALAGSGAGRIVYLRNLADATALKQALERARHLTVIGGGFIGLEVAASAVQLGCRATVVELLPRLLSRAVPPVLAEMLDRRHRAEGVAVLCGAGIAALEEAPGGRLELALADGRTLPTDLVLAGIGAVPRTALAAAAGLAVDNGIVVDGALATSDPDIFAAGDVTAFPHGLGGALLRLEAWQNAEAQGALVARSMLGLPAAEPSVPWFWSNQYDLTLQVAGWPDRGTAVVERPMGEGARLLFHIDETDRLVGVSGVGPTSIGRDVRLGQMMMERGLSPDPAALADPGVRLKVLLK